MKATVKPRKQLEYELKRDGYVYENGGHIKGEEIFFCGDMFDFCLEEIKIEEIDDMFYDFCCGDGNNGYWYWKKEWFIPNSFRVMK